MNLSLELLTCLFCTISSAYIKYGVHSTFCLSVTLQTKKCKNLLYKKNFQKMNFVILTFYFKMFGNQTSASLLRIILTRFEGAHHANWKASIKESFQTKSGLRWLMLVASQADIIIHLILTITMEHCTLSKRYNTQ